MDRADVLQSAQSDIWSDMLSRVSHNGSGFSQLASFDFLVTAN